MLTTNEYMKKRHMIDSDQCSRCGSKSESIMHVLMDCEEIQKFWFQFVSQDCWANFFGVGLHDWLLFNLDKFLMQAPISKWSSFFDLMIYYLWRDRNDVVFNNKSNIQSTLIQQILSQVRLIHLDDQQLPLIEDCYSLGSSYCVDSVNLKGFIRLTIIENQ